MGARHQDPQIADLHQRMVALEEWIMHTDRLLQNLNQVVCSLQDRLDEQLRSIQSIGATVEERLSLDNEPRSLEDERPPHY